MCDEYYEGYGLLRGVCFFTADLTIANLPVERRGVLQLTSKRLKLNV